MRLGPGLGLMRTLGESTPPIITQNTPATFGPYVAGDTPEDAYTPGTYLTTIGDIDTVEAVWTVNGSPALGTDVLAEDDVVGLSELVTNTNADTRPFSYGTAVTGAETTAPTISGTSPADNATGVADTVSPTITFDEPVVFGTGLITLRENDGGWADLETFDVTSDVGTGNGQVSISGAVLTINPTASLTAGVEYAIRIAATAIDDTSGNSFAGVTDDTTISFTVASSDAVNTLAPFFVDANEYAGGPYSANEGVWSSGTTSVAMTLERSDDGVGTWTDEGTLATTGTWDTALSGKYLRIKAVGQPGDVVEYSDVFGPLGLAYDRVLDLAGNSNYLNHTVSAPFVGTDLGAGTTGASAPGFWMMAEWFFDGTSLEGDAGIMSLGDASASNTQAVLGPAKAGPWRDGGSASYAEGPVVGSAGWYLTTGYYYNTGGDHQSKLYHEAASATGNLAGSNLSLTNFTTLRIGAWVDNVGDSANNFDERISWVAFGRGDPSAAHAWAYNSGRKRRVDGYDFASDATCSLDGFVLCSRVGADTVDTTDFVDSVGSFDSWTVTGTGLTWAEDQPGFIDPTAPPPATPTTYIFPRYADTTDTTLHLCINTKKATEAVGGDFTVTALTYDDGGGPVDISGTVSGATFPNPGAGTITGTINGVSVACEIVTPLALTAYAPSFKTRYSGNARVAAIESYTSPGAGTSYGSVALLKAGIDGLSSGGTLIVADADFTSGGALTLTAKDYGGATITCTNRHLVILDSLGIEGVKNLTLRGFKVIGGISGASGVNGVVLDHCTAAGIAAFGSVGNETFKVSNWCGPDDASETTLYFSTFERVTLHRVAHARVANDILRTDYCNTVMLDRVYLGDNDNTDPAAHLDAWQLVGSGSQGFTGGLALNCVFNDIQESGETASQGASSTIFTARHLRFKNCAIRSSLTGSLTITGPDQGNSYQNITVSQRADFTVAASNAAYVDNIVKNAAGAVLPSAGVGVETNVDAGVVMSTAYPQWVSHEGTWEQWDNPATGYDTKGAGALITALAANKASYP